jgi:hypothetical protein
MIPEALRWSSPLFHSTKLAGEVSKAEKVVSLPMPTCSSPQTSHVGQVMHVRVEARIGRIVAEIGEIINARDASLFRDRAQEAV